MPPTFLVVSYRSYDFPYDAETWNIAGLPHIWLDSASYYTGRPDVRVMFFKDGVHDGFADICRTEETKGACKVMEVLRAPEEISTWDLR